MRWLTRRLRAFRRDGRGAVLWLAAAAITVLAVGTAFASDVGMAYVARAEAQRVADAAALAGAVALIETPGDLARSRRIAVGVAASNTVRHRPVVLQDEDVELDTRGITVHVRRWRSRGEGLPTTFARLIGIRDLQVAARARAEVTGASGAACLKPFVVPDLWADANGNGRYDPGELYDPHVTGYGTTFRNDGFTRDVGRPVTLKAGSPSTAIVSSWYFLLRISGNQGGEDIRRTISSSECRSNLLRYGDELMADQETGAKKGPTRQGINDLIAQDPNAWWDPVTNRVRGSNLGDDAWRGSPRLMNIAVFDPRQPVEPGTRPVRITNFATVFLERTVGDDIVGRFITMVGVGAGGDCAAEGRCAPFASTVRLTE